MSLEKMRTKLRTKIRARRIARARRGILGDPTAEYIRSGEITSVVAPQSAQGGQTVRVTVHYKIRGEPPGMTYKIVSELGNKDVPGTTYSGKWASAVGDGRASSVTMEFTMPYIDVNFYATLWDENWKFLDDHPAQSIGLYVPPPAVDPGAEEPVAPPTPPPTPPTPPPPQYGPFLTWLYKMFPSMQPQREKPAGPSARRLKAR